METLCSNCKGLVVDPHPYRQPTMIVNEPLDNKISFGKIMIDRMSERMKSVSARQKKIALGIVGALLVIGVGAFFLRGVFLAIAAGIGGIVGVVICIIGVVYGLFIFPARGGMWLGKKLGYSKWFYDFEFKKPNYDYNGHLAWWLFWWIFLILPVLVDSALIGLYYLGKLLLDVLHWSV